MTVAAKVREQVRYARDHLHVRVACLAPACLVKMGPGRGVKVGHWVRPNRFARGHVRLFGVRMPLARPKRQTMTSYHALYLETAGENTFSLHFLPLARIPRCLLA
jgi:hypothetical protein